MFKRINNLLAHDDGRSRYLAGDKITIADFNLFSMTSSVITPTSFNQKALNEAMRESMEDYELVYKWFKRMEQENKTYLDTRIQAYI